MDILQIVVMAFLVEAVWETLKLIKEKDKISFDRIGALLVGVIIALIVQKDILVVTQLTSDINVVGVVLTGILASRGGNFIHDFFRAIQNISSEEE